jgi:hypothetical protein
MTRMLKKMRRRVVITGRRALLFRNNPKESPYNNPENEPTRSEINAGKIVI